MAAFFLKPRDDSTYGFFWMGLCFHLSRLYSSSFVLADRPNTSKDNPTNQRDSKCRGTIWRHISLAFSLDIWTSLSRPLSSDWTCVTHSANCEDLEFMKLEMRTGELNNNNSIYVHNITGLCIHANYLKLFLCLIFRSRILEILKGNISTPHSQRITKKSPRQMVWHSDRVVNYTTNE
jgi:hypothetical protein